MQSISLTFYYLARRLRLGCVVRAGYHEADADHRSRPPTEGIIQAHLARESVGPPPTLAFIGALAISLMSASFDFWPIQLSTDFVAPFQGVPRPGVDSSCPPLRRPADGLHRCQLHHFLLVPISTPSLHALRLTCRSCFPRSPSWPSASSPQALRRRASAACL